MRFRLEQAEAAELKGVRLTTPDCRSGQCNGPIPRGTREVPYRRAGTWQESREHLTTAGTMFVEMERQYWRDLAEAELKKLA